MKIAFISDIHGNSWALESVLQDIQARQIKTIYDLGDSLYGPLDPLGTFRLFDQYGIPSLAGNDDRFIIENTVSNSTHTYVMNCLKDSAALHWLKSLLVTRVIYDKLLLCHASPNDDNTYLLEDIRADGYVNVKNIDVLEDELDNIHQSFILCGHSHCPRIVTTFSKTLINVGSIGLPAYCADYPIKHMMQTFCNLARYCVLDVSDKICVEQIAVNYDY